MIKKQGTIITIIVVIITEAGGSGIRWVDMSLEKSQAQSSLSWRARGMCVTDRPRVEIRGSFPLMISVSSVR